MANFELRPKPNSSIWNLPGLEKDTFYAAALYLHAAKGELEGKPLYREPKTPEATRDFLDRLADCFARSKLQDARDHVSATAMVRNEEKKKITLFIAKNQSKNGSHPPTSQQERGATVNENDVFAKELMDWFNKLSKKATGQTRSDSSKGYLDIFKKMCEFTRYRLEHYIRKIGESDIDNLERVVLINLEDKFLESWELAKLVINECGIYQEAKSKLTDPTSQASCLLAIYVHLAGQVRKYPGFRALSDEIETSLSHKAIKLRELAQTVKWIDYLGRLYAAYASFSKFCSDKSQSGYSFDYYLLESRDDDWVGNTYIQKIQSWTGDLGLTEERTLRKIVDGRTVVEHTSIETQMTKVVKIAGNKARVHCEMQLLMYFSQPGVEKCMDYFGCSKKSCWLCWQMILQNSKYSMKNTHRKLYPRWAFPFDFSSTQPVIAEGLRVAYVEMLSLIQDKVVKKIPLSSLEPYPQTSARITRRDSTSNYPGQDFEGELFSFNPIAAPDRFPSVTLPALHLPAGQPPGKSRRVQVYGYEEIIDDLPISGSTIINGKKHIFAFELLTYHNNEQHKSNTLHYGWKSSPWIPCNSLFCYLVYHRSAEDILTPNPYILSLWRKLYNEDPEFFPWRGDVFIVVLPFDGRKVTPELPQIDDLACLKALEDYFKSKGPNYAGEQWDLYQWLLRLKRKMQVREI